MAEIKLVLDGARLAELLHSPTGPVGRHMIERGELVKQGARARAPRKSGCLQGSIVKRVEDRVEGIAIRVIADTSPCSPDRKSYALFVHNGTQAHTIEAKNAGVLSFEWHGERVFFASVLHPATRGHPFLRDSLPLAVA
jgi:hypothetical protein